MDVERIIDEVRTRGAGLVALQLPEGLKRRAPGLVKAIEDSTEATVLVSADPCYGACDLVDSQLLPLGVDLVVHYGHTPLGDTIPEIPTVFIEASSDLEIGPAVRDALPMLPDGGRIGLLSTTQHRGGMDEAMAILDTAGLSVKIGEGGRRLAFPGQVLGCDLSAARVVAEDVDSFLLLGGGSFHAIGIGLATGRPVVVADVEMGRARSVDDDRDRVLRRRSAIIAKASDATTFGILVESRPGQQRWALASRLREMLIEEDRRPVMLLLREVSSQRLEAVGMDAYVSTACPRIAVDDQSTYPMPVLTPQELEIMLGRASWEGYVLDEIG
jgi:2-(3-amino-3-carboxypropyl)histidine synthase